MKFTRDICRLLGLGGDVPGEEEVGVHDEASGLTDRGKDQRLSQVMLSNEEGLDDEEEEERARRRAERKRAKKKRQKERKKLEKEEKMEDVTEQQNPGEVAAALSESVSEEEQKEEAQWTEVHHSNRCNLGSVSALVTTENRSNCQLPQEASEEEPEWDVSSAFVANAASHIKGWKNRATQIGRENEENEAGSSQVENTEEMKRRAVALTVQGIQMFEQGRFSQAVDLFTQAICCDPEDHRFYGNRSYCYSCLEQYSSALMDAQRSIQLAPDWPKGFFRKGCALIGLKRYSEAEKALEQVLKLDQSCREASSKLLTCRVLQLMEMGFEEEHSKQLLEKFTTVQAAITSPESKALKPTSLQDQSRSCCSLWVGNITFDVTQQDLLDLFTKCGDVESVRLLHERFCAFINFKNANMAAKALEKLQGVELGSSKLVMRYPDRWIQRTLPSIQTTNTSLGSAGMEQSIAAAGSRCRASGNGYECFHWRTTGCFYGDKCRFKHI